MHTLQTIPEVTEPPSAPIAHLKDCNANLALLRTHDSLNTLQWGRESSQYCTLRPQLANTACANLFSQTLKIELSYGSLTPICVYRKFGGTQNGAKSKAKQSTLAFNQKSSKPEETNDSARKDDVHGVEDEASDMEMQEQPPAAKANGKKTEETPSDYESSPASPSNKLKREQEDHEEEDDDSDDQPVLKRRKKNSAPEPKDKTTASKVSQKAASNKAVSDKEEAKRNAEPSRKSETAPVAKTETNLAENPTPKAESEATDKEVDSASEDEQPEVAAKKRETLQTTLKSSGKDPYPDWKARDPVPYAALCTTFSLIEMTTKRLQISAHCSLFLQQVLRLTPNDLLPTVQLMINKLAADYAGIELGIGESLIIKAISESTGRPLSVTKSDHQKIGDLGLVAAKSRSTQGTMFKPKPLTVRGVHEGLLAIAKMEGHGSQDKKVGAIKKLLAAADVVAGTKGIDITKDKGGPSESKFLVRFLEGKLRLGLAEKTVIVALAQAVVTHEIAQNGKEVPSADQLAKGEAALKDVYR